MVCGLPRRLKLPTGHSDDILDGNKGLPRAWVHVAPHVLLMSLIDHLIAASLPVDRHRVALVAPAWPAMLRLICSAAFRDAHRRRRADCRRCGDPLLAPNMASVSVWVWHGRQDVKVPLNASRQMVAAVARARGAPTARGIGHRQPTRRRLSNAPQTIGLLDGAAEWTHEHDQLGAQPTSACGLGSTAASCPGGRGCGSVRADVHLRAASVRAVERCDPMPSAYRRV